jgi:hypothetical protein
MNKTLQADEALKRLEIEADRMELSGLVNHAAGVRAAIIAILRLLDEQQEDCLPESDF